MVAEDEIAFRIVNNCLGLKEDDMVWVETWQHTLGMASSIVVECRKIGATTLLTLVTDDAQRRTLKEVEERKLRKIPKHHLRALDSITAYIGIAGPENPGIFEGIEPRNVLAFNEKWGPIFETMNSRKVKQAFLTIGYVTPQRARAYGFDCDEWRKMMYEGLSVDYRQMKETGEKIAKALRKSAWVHLTSLNGTDLKFEIKTRPVHIDDGIITEHDIEKGSFSMSLPVGSVSVPPNEESIDGIVRFDIPCSYGGNLIKGLEWTFKNGHLTNFMASENVDVLLDTYNKATGDKNKLGWLSIGINPYIKPIGFSCDDIALGAVSLGIGVNQIFGGNNKSNFSFGATIRRPTLSLDQEILIENGKLLMLN